MEVLKKVINELPDCWVEALITNNEVSTLKFDSNKFSKSVSGDQVKLEVRVTNGLRSGYAWTNKLSEWRECVLRAEKLMKASSELKTKPLISKAPKNNKRFIHQSFTKASDSILKNKGLSLINKTLEKKVNVSELIINKKLNTKQFLNSNLTSFRQEQSSIEGGVECSSGDCSVWEVFSAPGLIIDFEGIGAATAQLCLDSLNPKKLSPGLMNVVLDFNAVNELMQVLLPSLLANNIVEHNSFLEGRVGEEVISNLLTIKDVGVLPNGTNNQVMDFEGTPVTNKSLFNKGVLQGFLNDLYTAVRIKAEPTGNSAGLLKRGMIGPNNIIIKSGSASRDELLTDCVYIHSLMGSHTANTVSGDFALSALNAFKYEGGERVPLRDVMISGNIFQFFKKTSLIGRESRCVGNFKTPLIKFRNAQLIG